MKKYEYENYIPDNENTIKDKTKNIKLRNKVIALLTSVVLGATGYITIKEYNKNKEKIEEPITTYKPIVTVQPTNTPQVEETYVPINTPIIQSNKSNVIDRGDSIRTTAELNMRLSTTKDSFKTGTINKDSIIGRILSLNGFDLVRYYNQLSFVSSEYTDSNVTDYNNEYYSVEEYNDIIHTTTEVNFRLGPSKCEDKIQL